MWCAHVTRGVCEADTVIPDARPAHCGLLPLPPCGLAPPESAVRHGSAGPEQRPLHAAGRSEPPKEPGLPRAPSWPPPRPQGALA